MIKNYMEESLVMPHHLDGGGYIHPSAKVHGGKAYLDLTGGLEIEKGVIINTGVTIYTHNHHYAYKNWKDRPFFECSLVIEEDVWIGKNAMIMPGVKTIGKGCIIAPGAVLTRSTLPYEMWGGNPAMFIKKVII